MTEEQTQRCMLDCAQRNYYIDSVTAHSCCKCGELFPWEPIARQHEKSYTFSPTEVLDEDEPTCMSCAHGDLEGRRSLPCPQYNFAPVVLTCEKYERAHH